MSARRLLDVEHKERVRYNTGAELVAVPLHRCPECDGELRLELLRQDTLLRGGGYGGTQRVETWECTVCPFSRVVAVATERPPRVVAELPKGTTPHAAKLENCMADEYIELTGDDLPYHLREDAPPLAECNRCGRVTWDADEIDTTDKMPQPNGGECGGRFISRVRPGRGGGG